MNKKARTTGIQKAVAIAGGVRPLARLTGIDKGVVVNMNKRGVVLPHHCKSIHRATGVPLAQLNPQIYGAD